jgi:hypothetical protein
MSTLATDIKQCVPQDIIYIRKKDERAPATKQVPNKFGNNLTVGNAGGSLKKQATKVGEEKEMKTVTKGVTMASAINVVPADQGQLN